MTDDDKKIVKDNLSGVLGAAWQALDRDPMLLTGARLGRPRKPEHLRRVALTVTLPAPLLAELGEAEATTGLNRSQIIERALKLLFTPAPE